LSTAINKIGSDLFEGLPKENFGAVVIVWMILLIVA
jgi:hypothetical protein